MGLDFIHQELIGSLIDFKVGVRYQSGARSECEFVLNCKGLFPFLNTRHPFLRSFFVQNMEAEGQAGP